jgi:hypothetical protein
MMRERLIAEHRRIEAELERLTASMEAGLVDLGAFRQAYVLCRDHYAHEQEFLEGAYPEAARKLGAQHAEVLEIAGHVEGSTSDTVYLVRRFVALAQHNIIEEERDFFPLC